MKFSLPKSYTNKCVKAIAEFSLIQEGDHILVGLSGGKDSAFLLYILVILQKYLGINFTLSAITVDLGFDEKKQILALKEYCVDLGVELFVKTTKIAEYINKETNNHCAKCSLFKRGALVEFMKEKKIKKLAFGHHYDDAVETFLMSILYSGQLKTFQAKQYLRNNDIDIIRPLIYLREKEIIEASKYNNYQAIKSICPYDGKTKREEIKQTFKKYFQDKQTFYNMVAAMRQGTTIELWPEELSRQEITTKMKELWLKS